MPIPDERFEFDVDAGCDHFDTPHIQQELHAWALEHWQSDVDDWTSFSDLEKAYVLCRYAQQESKWQWNTAKSNAIFYAKQTARLEQTIRELREQVAAQLEITEISKRIITLKLS